MPEENATDLIQAKEVSQQAMPEENVQGEGASKQAIDGEIVTDPGKGGDVEQEDVTDAVREVPEQATTGGENMSDPGTDAKQDTLFDEENVNWEKVQDIITEKQQNKLFSIYLLGKKVHGNGKEIDWKERACCNATPMKRKHSPELNNPQKLGGSLKDLASETSSPILRAPRFIDMRERTYSIASGLGTPSNRRKKQAFSKIKGRARCNSTKSCDRNQRRITDMLEPRQENVPDEN